MFREVGFTDVTGTNGIDAAVLGAYAIALNRLEREYDAFYNPDDMIGEDGKPLRKKGYSVHY